MQFQKSNEDLETQVAKLKASIRNNMHHHELNSKRLREKLAIADNELVKKVEEV